MVYLKDYIRNEVYNFAAMRKSNKASDSYYIFTTFPKRVSNQCSFAA